MNFNEAHALTGEELYQQQKQKNSGFLTDKSFVTVSIQASPKEEPVQKSFFLYALEADDEHNGKFKIEVTAPKRYEGLMLLVHFQKNKETDQWLYLPSSNKTKRITGGAKQSSFLGSDLTYEDMTLELGLKNSKEVLKEVSKAERTGYLIYRVLKDSPTYSKAIIFIEKSHLQPLYVELYDKQNQLVKTLEASGYQLLEGQYWRPRRVLVKNNKTGSSSLFSFENHKLRQKLPLKTWSKEALSR